MCIRDRDWLLNNVYALNKEASFQAYALEDADGKVNCKHNDATNGYMVVSKEFAHPELAVEIANLFYDELANSSSVAEEFPEVAKYMEDGVDAVSYTHLDVYKRQDCSGISTSTWKFFWVSSS